MPTPAQSPAPTIVFDLDGTLVDTAPDLAHATNHILRLAGVGPVDADVVRPFVGRGARAMIVEALAQRGKTQTDSEIEVLLREFVAFYGKTLTTNSRPYDEVPEVLSRLAQSGAKLAVCTNKLELLSRKLLKGLGLDRLFQAIVGRDTLPVCKPDPGHLIGTIILADGNLDRAILVGDSEIDVQTGKAAGIPVIGVTFGYTSRPIQSFGPEGVIDHFGQLEDRIIEVLQAAEIGG